MQIELLLRWRFPPDSEKAKDAKFKRDAELVELRDEAMYGKVEKPENPYEGLEGYDYLDIEDGEDV